MGLEYELAGNIHTEHTRELDIDIIRVDNLGCNSLYEDMLEFAGGGEIMRTHFRIHSISAFRDQAFLVLPWVLSRPLSTLHFHTS